MNYSICSRSRRVSLLALLVFPFAILFLGLIVISISLRPFARLPARPLTRPPPLTPMSRLPPRTADSRPPHPDDWARPRVNTVTGVRGDGGMQIFLFTQGIYAPAFGWELKVVGCIFGERVLNVTGAYKGGTYSCWMPGTAKVESRVSVVIEKDAKSLKVWKTGVNMEDKGVKGGRVWVEGDLVSGEEVDGLVWEGTEGTRFKPEDVLYVRSGVKWEGQVDGAMPKAAGDGGGEGRYQICLATQEKVNPWDLETFLEYHRRIGVDQFFVYDNHASEDLAAASWANAKDVEVVYWPFAKSQLTAHSHALIMTRRRCEWLLLIDVDEYVYVHDKKPRAGMPALKRAANSWISRGVDWCYMRDIPFGPSGHVMRPDLPDPEAYTFILLPWPKPNLGKSIVRTDVMTPESSVHSIRPDAPHKSHRHVGRRVLPPSLLSSDGAPRGLSKGEFYVAHYKSRSWEDMVRKGAGGRNSIFVRDWAVSRGSDEWSIDKPPKGYADPPKRTKPWSGMRDYFKMMMHPDRKSKGQMLVRVEGGKRCYSTVGWQGEVLYGYCEIARGDQRDPQDVEMAKAYSMV